MKNIFVLASAIFIVILSSNINNSEACYWDSDTLAMEKRRFPQTIQLITGRFLRHSPGFYTWRITNRKNILRTDPKNLRALDDLAVALDKRGHSQEAIKTALRALALDSNRYETHANLGTFYLSANKLKKGLFHIKRAIEINPNAHFGRELVQQRLVEYILHRQAQKQKGLPLYRGGDEGEGCTPPYKLAMAQAESLEKKPIPPKDPWICIGRRSLGFAHYIKQHNLSNEKAIKGILGMLKFANHKSPVLLEVLGDLLISLRGTKKDAKRLAARAYLRASYVVKAPKARAFYRAKALLALVGHRYASLSKVEKKFRRELLRAKRWFNKITQNEKKWIAAGKNPEKKFRKKYKVRLR